jgi:hypothetical protein
VAAAQAALGLLRLLATNSRFITDFRGTLKTFQSTSTGLRRRRYPGAARRSNNPEGVASEHADACVGLGRYNPFRVEASWRGTPRVARSRNPGLNDRTPLAFCLAVVRLPEIRDEPNSIRSFRLRVMGDSPGITFRFPDTWGEG